MGLGGDHVKRDMSIVREIIKQIGDSEGRLFSGEFAFDDMNVSKEKLDYHLIIMKNAGIIEGTHKIIQGEIIFYSYYLGWLGNDFHETFKDDNIWQGAKSYLIGKGMEISNVPFDFLMELGKELLSNMWK